QEGDGTEIQKKETLCFHVMSRSFTDPAKAEENLQILNQLKDPNCWKILTQLIDPNTSSLQAIDLRDDLLKIVGEKHQIYEFLSIFTIKSSYILFDKTHAREILLEAGLHKSSGCAELILSCMTILVILARFCPSLLHGIEADLVRLLDDDNEIMKEGALHILAKAGGTIREQLGVSSSSLDLILERICIEGSRRQAKYAVHALASITKDDGLMSLSVLYKRLVDMLGEKTHLPAVLQSLGCIAQAAMPVYETRESEVENFIKENILKHGQVLGDEATSSWDERSELCSLKAFSLSYIFIYFTLYCTGIFGIKTLVKSFLPVKDAHLRSGIDNIIGIIKNILLFGDISEDITSSSLDKAHLKLAAAKAVLRLSKQWDQKIPVDVFYLTLRTSEDKYPEVKKLLLSKVHQYVRDRILDPKYSCAFLLALSSSEVELEENKRNLSDIIQMCQPGKGRQISLLTDSVNPPIYPESILIYIIHSIAHHPSFPNADDCKDVKSYEAIYRQLYVFLSMLVDVDADGKTDASIRKDKESASLLSSIFQSIRNSEDVFDSTKSKNSYALCELGMAIIKRLVGKHGELQNLSIPVALPPMLYRLLGNQDDSNSQTTWLSNEDVLAHFDSLKMEANVMDRSVISEDEIMKDSDTEASEMPLGKLMKRLKAKAAKTKKEAKNEATLDLSSNMEIDILKVVNEINDDNLGTNSKFEQSNGNENARKRKGDTESQKKEKLKTESEDAPFPKRRRTSVQAHKSSSTVGPKGSKKKDDVHVEKTNFDFEGSSDEEPRPASEDQNIKDRTPKATESELLFSSIRKKYINSKQKGKRVDRDHGEILSSTPQTKKSKSVGRLEKCTTKEDDTPADDIVGCKIKVWWPMDEKYYEGIVKSFDEKKKKHVVLYDDGDVEVLRLDKERWKHVE
ncbi:hypothetical protein M569_11220, partial [Genlisea aurea]